ncbi:MAG: stage III sporulation protein AE [Clostridiales bacterium]|nr:stage III sporulation protein AE [Clostridiales bacterium]
MRKILIAAVLCFLAAVPAFGADLDGKLSDFNFSEAAEAFEENTGISVDFGDMVKKTVKGDSKGLLKTIAGLISAELLGESHEALKGLRLLIVIALLGGFLKNLMVCFTDKETAETGFGVCYMLTVGTAMGAYLPMVRLMEEYSRGLTDIVTGALPLMLTLITAGGRPVEALSYSGAVAAGAALCTNGIRLFAVPLMKLAAVICVVNCISEEGMIEKLFNVLKTAVKYSVRGAVFIFTFIIGLNKLSSSLGENALKKGTENIVGMVPVAGDIIKGSVGTGLVIINSIKSGAGAVFAVLILIYALLPVLRVLITGFAFKIIAGLIEPVCDKRITKLLDSLGDLTLLILSLMFGVCYMFVFSALVFTALAAG